MRMKNKLLILLLSVMCMGLKFPPQVVSVTMNDKTEIAVVKSEELSVPEVDDTFGLIDVYPQPLFVAHDYLAGDHILNMMKGGFVTVNFSDGTSRRLQITGYLNLGFDSSGERQYIDEGCFYFQTCHGDGIRTLIACDVHGI